MIVLCKHKSHVERESCVRDPDDYQRKTIFHVHMRSLWPIVNVDALEGMHHVRWIKGQLHNIASAPTSE